MDGIEWMKCPDCGGTKLEKFRLIEPVTKHRKISIENDLFLVEEDFAPEEGPGDSHLACQVRGLASEPENAGYCQGIIELPIGHPFWEQMDWA